MKRLIVLLAMAIAVGGCVDQPPRPSVPLTVRIPVPVPCKVTQPSEPAWAVDALPLGSDIWTQMTALRAERMQRKGYESELIAAIQACQ